MSAMVAVGCVDLRTEEGYMYAEDPCGKESVLRMHRGRTPDSFRYESSSKSKRGLAVIALLKLSIALVVFCLGSNKGSRQPKLSSEAAFGSSPLSAGAAIAASSKSLR